MKKMSFAIYGFSQKMNITIVCRFRRRNMRLVQVWFSEVKVLCRVRISGRFVRIGPDFGIPSASPILQSRLIDRECVMLVHSWVHIWNLHKFRLHRVFDGPLGLSCVELRSVSDFRGKSSAKPIVLQDDNPKPGRNSARGFPKGPLNTLQIPNVVWIANLNSEMW